MDFYAIGVDPGEDLQRLQKFTTDQGHPWSVAKAPAGMAQSYRITSQSTKVAIDGGGVIVYRAGYGRGNDEAWHEVFRRLAAG